MGFVVLICLGELRFCGFKDAGFSWVVRLLLLVCLWVFPGVLLVDGWFALWVVPVLVLVLVIIFAVGFAIRRFGRLFDCGFVVILSAVVWFLFDCYFGFGWFDFGFWCWLFDGLVGFKWFFVFRCVILVLVLLLGLVDLCCFAL